MPLADEVLADWKSLEPHLPGAAGYCFMVVDEAGRFKIATASRLTHAQRLCGEMRAEADRLLEFLAEDEDEGHATPG